jgi:L-threonylcarbamoyladenylate synthase
MSLLDAPLTRLKIKKGRVECSIIRTAPAARADQQTQQAIETSMWMHLLTAARRIRQGGVVAYPTEGVYGLGCNPLDARAVERILEIKQRDPGAGLILLAADLEQLRPFMEVSDVDLERLDASWPGPVTWLVPATDRVPALVRGRHDTVAVRVSGHPLARQLARLAGTPLVSTSANRSGRPAAVNHFQVRRQLGMELDFVVTGHCQTPGQPSRIIDLVSGKTLR